MSEMTLPDGFVFEKNDQVPSNMLSQVPPEYRASVYMRQHRLSAIWADRGDGISIYKSTGVSQVEAYTQAITEFFMTTGVPHYTMPGVDPRNENLWD